MNIIRIAGNRVACSRANQQLASWFQQICNWFRAPIRNPTGHEPQGICFRLRLAILAATLCCTAVQASPGEPASASPASTVTEIQGACTHVSSADVIAGLQGQGDIPSLQGRVTDTTSIVTATCKAELNHRLADLESATGTQLALLVVPSTGNESIEEFATAVFEKWKLGQKDVDNGLLLVAALKDHRVRIEVGYGLEGAIPDVVAARIIRTRIAPAFRTGNFESGLSAAVDDITQRWTAPPQDAENQSGSPNEKSRASNRDWASKPAFWIALVLVSVAFGVIAAWRQLRWQVFVLVSYLVSSAVLIVCLPPGFLDSRDAKTAVTGALLLPAIVSVVPCLLGIGLYRSTRVRKYTAITVTISALVIAIGHAMGYSAGDTLGTVFGVVIVGLVVLGKLADMFGFLGGSRSPSSSGSSWFSASTSESSSSSSSSSSSDSSDGFSGDGGSSGGGGASDSW